ncbi:hypothetical protein Goshw_017664 [Gossypium schwendimanii]|uniref:Vacuolar iron transporter n=1 Tax=Gossypium schwendimanii TaxID=34291 RepID=A0A7J9MJ91_GOSSC|nr:hypothetical protein [Gossypium schwendimanii]
MASPHATEPCPEQTISVANETYQGTELVQRGQWIRAAILGANDGLLSTTSLMLGIGAANDDKWSMILSGLAGAIAGACSMAVGEFVSVSTQRDIEQASKTDTGMQNDGVNKLDMTCCATTGKASRLRETNLDAPCTRDPIEKMFSPVIILEPNLPQGLSPRRSPIIKVMTDDLKTKAPVTLVQDDDHDKENTLPNPCKAASASALSFLCGAVVPLASSAFIEQHVIRIVVIAVVSSIALAVFGCFGACLGGSPVRISAARVLFGGWVAMAITYGLLKPFDRYHHGSDTD